MTKKKILLIEDEAVLRSSVRMLLNIRGFDVVEAADGDIGMQYLTGCIAGRDEYHLILLDLMMPKISGIDILEYMVEEHVNIPVLVMTSMLDYDISYFCSKLESVCIIHKPFTSNEFFKKVNKMINIILPSVEEK